MLKNGNIWRCLSLLCLIVSGTFGQTVQNCPSHVAIAPCVCSVKKLGLDIICESTDHTHIGKAMDVLKGQPNTVIFYLKLRHNTLPKLQGFVFLGLVVQHLTIHNSSLAVVEESSLSSIGKQLTQLDLSQNSLNSVPSSALANLHNLLILNLNHNKINDLRGRSFAGLDTLEILNLYGNKISIIDKEAFTGLDDRKLKRLNLGGNQLMSVPTMALSSLDVLKKLEMHENRINSISEGDFEGLKSLDSLVMAHNMLREVPARAFSHLTQLNSLELDGNQITHVDPDAFIGLEENLQYLRLGDNNLHSVPSDALRRLHRLRHLDLRSNNITFLPEDAFTGYGDSITFLNLQKNLIKSLPPMILDNLNSPETLTATSWSQFRNSARPSIFKASSVYIFLALCSDELFCALTVKKIKSLPPMIFENLNSLETLNLQNNKLAHIPEDVTETVVDTLRMIDITDNPLICDCELRWFAMWLKNLREKDDEMMSKKRTVCMMLSENREYSVQHIPLEKMGCVGKNAGRTSYASATAICPSSIVQFSFLVGVAAFL